MRAFDLGFMELKGGLAKKGARQHRRAIYASSGGRFHPKKLGCKHSGDTSRGALHLQRKVFVPGRSMCSWQTSWVGTVGWTGITDGTDPAACGMLFGSTTGHPTSPRPSASHHSFGRSRKSSRSQNSAHILCVLACAQYYFMLGFHSARGFSDRPRRKPAGKRQVMMVCRSESALRPFLDASGACTATPMRSHRGPQPTPYVYGQVSFQVRGNRV